MSQEKVNKYKEEKYKRKHAARKSNIKKIASYAAATIIALALIVYLGYSVAVATGIYTPPVTTTHVEWSKDQVESLRNTLINQGDNNVKGNTTTAATENTTVQETTAASK